jgi:hypothetical protein
LMPDRVWASAVMDSAHSITAVAANLFMSRLSWLGVMQ